MIKAPVDLVSGGILLPGSQIAVVSLGPHVADRERKLFRVSCIRALISFECSTLISNHLPKTPPSNIITLGIRVQHLYWTKIVRNCLTLRMINPVSAGLALWRGSSWTRIFHDLDSKRSLGRDSFHSHGQHSTVLCLYLFKFYIEDKRECLHLKSSLSRIWVEEGNVQLKTDKMGKKE